MEVQPTATLPGIFRISFSIYLVLFGIRRRNSHLSGAGRSTPLMSSDLSHEPKPGILLRVSRTVVIQLANAAEFLDNGAVNLVLAFSRADRMGTYLVLLACEVPELAGDDGLSDKLRQFLLVVHVLVLLLYAEYGGFSGAMTGTEKAHGL